MPLSRKRKKKGKPVKPQGTLKVDPNKESSISLQDLINVVAYQEQQKKIKMDEQKEQDE